MLLIMTIFFLNAQLVHELLVLCPMQSFLQTFLFAELKALVSVSQAATYANLSGVTEP